jgi:hypothetical protein
VNKTALSLLLALFFAPSLASAQSFTVNAVFDPSHYEPLDGPQRFQRWLNEDGASPSMHLHAFALAAIAQSMNDPSQWGRTTGGFVRRVRNEYTGALIANSVHESLAAAEGTDPRYFPCACTGLFRRSGHALEMTLLTYNRNGRKTLDLPQLAGQYSGNMISTLWLPPHYSPLVQGVQSAHLQMGLIGVTHLVQEFSPELHRFFHVRTAPPAAVPNHSN